MGYGRNFESAPMVTLEIGRMKQTVMTKVTS